MVLDRIRALMEACEAGDPAFPPTVLFNENWLLRLVVDWFATHGGDRYPLSPAPGARWFSEARLPSAFLPRYRGDHLAEARSHADGVIGHFTIGNPNGSGLTLDPVARQLVILEGKLFNRLSAGVTNAPGYDQAARTVACLAEVLRRADADPECFTDLGFLVLAPQARIDDGVFSAPTSLESIRARVAERAAAYEGERDGWFRDWFEPTLRRLEIRSLGWEELIEAIAFHDPIAGQRIDSFYTKCLHFSRPRARAAFPGRRARGPVANLLPGPRERPQAAPRRPRPAPSPLG